MHSTKSLPTATEIMARLKPVSSFERFCVVATPLITIMTYFMFIEIRWYVPAFLSICYLSFVTYGSCCHDLVHCNFGYSRKSCQLWLSFIELLMMRSGTTYRVTHLNHHQWYPDFNKDPEGRASYFSFFRTAIEGPVFHAKLIHWTLKNGNHHDKKWVIAEFTAILLLWFTGLLLFKNYPFLLIYQVLVTMGAWAIPFVTSYLVHVPHEKEVIRQTKVFRGLFYRVIAFDHLYHLEHHLYPQIPSCRWKNLAEILNSYFQENGLRSIRLDDLKSSNFAIN